MRAEPRVPGGPPFPDDLILVTGGAGFIGSHFVSHLLQASPSVRVVNLDKLTYAGDRRDLEGLPDPSRCEFVLAAETHVDRSLYDPANFVQTNVIGVHVLLETARCVWMDERGWGQAECRFIQVFTDEVYGSLAPEAPAPKPRRSVSSHLTLPGLQGERRSSGPGLVWHVRSPRNCDKLHKQLRPVPTPGETHSLHPRKCGGGERTSRVRRRPQCSRLVVCRGSLPRSLAGARERGGGSDVSFRQWGRHGESRFGAADLQSPGCQATGGGGRPRTERIRFVSDRPGRDRRYALNIQSTRDALGWEPATLLEDGLGTTVSWFLEHRDWVGQIQAKREFQDWVVQNYTKRSRPGPSADPASGRGGNA